jgi:hypothetical protein
MPVVGNVRLRCREEAMSKVDRDEDEHFHECAQCAETEPCTALEWRACEGAGCDWFCSQDCADDYGTDQQQEREDEGHREDEWINEDDPSEDR